jgi:hypothetical protein
MSIPIVPMPPGAAFDFNMPAWTKTLIADCLIVFGRVEQKSIEVVWVVEGANVAKRVAIARRPPKENFEIAIRNGNTLNGSSIEKYLEAFVDLANLRNLIAHGAWVMVNGVPWVVWHKFIVDDGSVVGEFCQRERFEAFKRQANAMLRLLSDLHTQAEERAGIRTSAVSRMDQAVE